MLFIAPVVFYWPLLLLIAVLVGPICSIYWYYDTHKRIDKTEHFSNKGNAVQHKAQRFLKDVRGKHVCITGGSQGLGKAIAEACIRRGAKWITIISRTSEALEMCKRDLLALADHLQIDVAIQTISADVQDKKSVTEGFSKAMSGTGNVFYSQNAASESKCLPIDMLICNAGIAIPKEFDQLSTAEIELMINTNLYGALFSIRQVVPSMKENGSGIIVIISSEAGLCAVYGYSVYSATKYALNALAIALDHELRFYNILVCAAFPPSMSTAGYTQEMTTKPLITKQIEGTTTLLDPSQVAIDLLDNIQKGKQRITFGVMGHVLGIVSAGVSPVGSFFQFSCEVLLMGILRMIAVFVTSSWYRIIKDNLPKTN